MRRVALDALADQFADEASVADGFTSSLDVELRVEAIVEESLALTSLDRLTRRVVVEALALEVLPKPGLGAPLPREER